VCVCLCVCLTACVCAHMHECVHTCYGSMKLINGIWLINVKVINVNFSLLKLGNNQLMT